MWVSYDGRNRTMLCSMGTLKIDHRASQRAASSKQCLEGLTLKTVITVRTMKGRPGLEHHAGSQLDGGRGRNLGGWCACFRRKANMLGLPELRKVVSVTSAKMARGDVGSSQADVVGSPGTDQWQRNCRLPTSGGARVSFTPRQPSLVP